MADPHVKVDLRGLKRFQRAVSDGLRGGGGPVHNAIRQWAARYRSFAQQRFDRFSKGGGWPALKEKTINRRRKGKKGRGIGAAILRDTGTLFSALDLQFTQKPGQLQQDIPFGVRVGYGGPARHPKGGATVADIANFHQTGAGRLPVRKIIVDPDEHTITLMAGDMERALERTANRG